MSDRVARGVSIVGFVEWLAATSGSVALRESHYLFLVVLTVHVLTLLVFAGMAAVIDLRLLGFAMKRVPASDVVDGLMPWAIGGFVVMLLSGSLLFYSSPLDRYGNLFFRAKLVCLVLAGLNVVVFHKTVYARVASWDLDLIPPQTARIAGGLGLMLWVSIIVLGRMMAYQDYWFGS